MNVLPMTSKNSPRNKELAALKPQNFMINLRMTNDQEEPLTNKTSVQSISSRLETSPNRIRNSSSKNKSFIE